MTDGPVIQRRFKRRTVRNAIIGGTVILIVLLAGGGGWYAYNKYTTHTETETRQAAETSASDIAQQIYKAFDDVRKQLVAMTKEDTLLALFESGDIEALLTEAEQAKDQIKHALKLRYLIPGQYGLDKDSEPPLSFASLDLLRKAERNGGRVGVEVHLYATPQEHIVMIERVTNKATDLVGLIHLSLNTDIFDEVMKGISMDSGYAELQQTVAGKTLVLGKKGDAGFKQGTGTSKAINDSRWGLVYWEAQTTSSAKTDEDSSGGGMMFLLLLLVAGSAGAFFYIKKNRQEVGPTAAHVTYEGAIRAILEGAHPGVEKVIPNLPGEVPASTNPPSTKVSTGLSGDDITRIADLESVPEAAKPSPEQSDSEAKTDPAPAPAAEATEKAEEKITLNAGIFRAYDIRGIVDQTLTTQVVQQIGRAIGSIAHDRGQQGIVVGRDGRKSSTELSEALIKGLRASGRDVIDIGMVPTPVLYFATHYLETGSGVMLTGSHNAPEYNGLKIVLGDTTLSGDDIQAIYQRIKDKDFTSGQGGFQGADISDEYLRKITEDIPVSLGGAQKIVVDAGNGVAGTLAPALFKALGHDVVELYCDVDGEFPNHQPDPSQPENLQELINKVKEMQADLGFAFDGDGDRLGVVDAQGNIIWPDRQLMLLAKDVLSRNQGATIIFDVKCSRNLKTIIEESGGKPLMWKTGHSFIKNKMKEENAPLAGEMSGHIFFKERWYGFDDALYTAARMLEIITNAKTSATELFSTMPGGITTPELRMKLAEQDHGAFMDTFKEKMSFDDAEIIDIDGFRIEFSDGWGLIRPSNTTPYIIIRFEADSDAAMEKIQSAFRDVILLINPKLKVPF